MKTADAAKGRWPEILEHFGLPPITGKNHFKGECEPPRFSWRVFYL